jgi:hypothetical protein
MSLIVDINPVPWKILDLVKARILKNRTKKAKKGLDWSKETLRREMALSPAPLISRRRDEPSFVPSGRVHYSITVLDENVDYFKGSVVGGVFFGGMIQESAFWISKSQPNLTSLTGIISNYSGYTAVKLADHSSPAGGTSYVPGYFYRGDGSGQGSLISYVDNGINPEVYPALWMVDPVVTNTEKYSELLKRDWETWSKKSDFEYESQNGLGRVSGSDSKRFILLVPQKKDSPGIQVYPPEWPNLWNDSSPSDPPAGVTIPVARQEQSESVIAEPSDYMSLIEGATGIPWSDVSSVYIALGINPRLSDLQTFRTELTKMSIPFAVTGMGSVVFDEESWVNAHCTNP